MTFLRFSSCLDLGRAGPDREDSKIPIFTACETKRTRRAVNALTKQCLCQTYFADSKGCSSSMTARVSEIHCTFMAELSPRGPTKQQQSRFFHRVQFWSGDFGAWRFSTSNLGRNTHKKSHI